MRARLIFVCSFTLAAVLGVAAQDYIFTNFAASTLHELPPAPCPLAGPVQPVVYDTSVWLFHTCTDNRVFAQRFLHANDRAREYATPRPVFLVPSPTPDAGAPTPPPTGACPVGMVLTPQGGCVPPDHPLAAGGGQ